jgi:hypothetical protein
VAAGQPELELLFDDGSDARISVTGERRAGGTGQDVLNAILEASLGNKGEWIWIESEKALRPVSTIRLAKLHIPGL